MGKITVESSEKSKRQTFPFTSHPAYSAQIRLKLVYVAQSSLKQENRKSPAFPLTLNASASRRSNDTQKNGAPRSIV